MAWSGGKRGAIGLLALGVAIGLVIALAAEQGDRYFSSNAFCVSCHSMETNAYKEFKDSKHGTTATGVTPACAHCHVAAGLVPAWIDHVRGTRDLIAELSKNFSKQEIYDAALPRMADAVRMDMLANGSRNCLKCHVMAAIQPAKKRGQVQHQQAIDKGTANCIACHYNLAHREVPPSEDFLKAAEKFQ